MGVTHCIIQGIHVKVLMNGDDTSLVAILHQVHDAGKFLGAPLPKNNAPLSLGELAELGGHVADVLLCEIAEIIELVRPASIFATRSTAASNPIVCRTKSTPTSSAMLNYVTNTCC